MPKKNNSVTNKKKNKDPPTKITALNKQAIDQARKLDAEERVTLIRKKLKNSLEDPQMREQVVRAIRTMLNEK